MELCLDVVVMDLVMFEMDGVEVILVLLKDWLEVVILVLIFYLDNEKIYFVIEVGVKGYMLKILSVVEIFNVICKVLRGE